ncbi:hypothetical protein OUZ56_033294 [Daphnia magna]|uniref:Uncharacterized protein n=1 Tax=Daphnia magna TaxID=35525 RepID=A0ABR0BAJ9_9CRUS|nr:hypothetical protein OUZ56_033294 [Daphnia magna]
MNWFKYRYILHGGFFEEKLYRVQILLTSEVPRDREGEFTPQLLPKGALKLPNKNGTRISYCLHYLGKFLELDWLKLEQARLKSCAYLFIGSTPELFQF